MHLCMQPICNYMYIMFPDGITQFHNVVIYS